jgi:outer membrane protein OmpA-like peptidoglycan-associated protein
MMDLMTSLAVIFILLLVYYLDRVSKTNSRDIDKENIEVISQKLKDKGLETTIDPNDPYCIVERVDDNTLNFELDKSVIKEKGKIFLDDFIPKLANVVCTSKDEIESVLIQGYTDSTGGYEHNLALSQARAYSIMLYAINNAHLQNTDKECLLDLIAISGRGPRDLMPITSEGYSKPEKRIVKRVDVLNLKFKLDRKIRL